MKSSTEIIAATLISSALYGDSPIILVVKSNQISLFNLQGDLIDQLGEDFGVPTNISAIKVNQESIIFKTASGGIFKVIAVFQFGKRLLLFENQAGCLLLKYQRL